MDTLDPALELIFLQAGCAARRSAFQARTEETLSRVHFGQLAHELAARRLLPLVGTRLIQVAGESCPEEFHLAVRAARTNARVRGLVVEAATHRAVRMLADHDIPALPLKGPLLAQAAHGDVGLRETQDVDLLVPRSQLQTAAHLMLRKGFHEPTDPLRAGGLPDLHLALRHPREPSVELHWRVHWHEEAFSQEMLARARPGPDGLLRAQGEDLATAMLLFYARDGLLGLRLACDLAAWWDRHGESLSPRFLETHSRSHPTLGPALTAAAVAVEDLTGTPTRRQLGSATVNGRRTTLAVRLADWTQAGDRDQLAANVSLTNGLLGPRGSGGAFVRRELMPSTGAIQHAAKTLARYALALWRLRGGRRWSETPEVPQR